MNEDYRKVVISGIPTAITVREGDGPTLLCIHGNSLSRHLFAPLFASEQLRGRRLVCYDLPGHGASDWSANPADGYTLHAYAAHLAALVAATDTQSCVLLGLSLGGHIAVQALAAGLVPRTAGLVSVGAPPISSPGDLARAFLALPGGLSLFNEQITATEAQGIAACIGAHPADHDGLVTAITTTDPRARSALLQDLVRTPYRDEWSFLEQAPVPALLCFGEKDQAVNLAYLDPHGRGKPLENLLCILPGAAHLPDLRRPDGFMSRLKTFLDRIDA